MMNETEEENLLLKETSLSKLHKKGWKSNRWVVFTLTTLLLTFNCRIFASPHYGTLFVGGKKYDWLCGPDDKYEVLREGFKACHPQRLAFARLFSIMMCCENVGCFAGGFLFDKTGPRITAIVGLILTMIGYLLMIFATEEVDTMKAGAVFGGLAVNIVAFPSLILEDYFPAHGTLCAAFALACQGLGSLVAPLALDIWYAWDLDFYTIWKYYIYYIFIPISVLYVWITPWKRTPVSAVSAKVDKKLEIELHSASHEVADKPRSSITSTIAEIGASLQTLMQALTTREYILMTIVSTFCILVGTYYMAAIQGTANADVLEYMSKMMPLDALYGTIQGKLCEIVTTPVMMIIQLLSYCLLSFLCLMGPGKIQYFTIQFLIATCSFSSTIKYTYVQETFASYLSGALIGICGTLGGLVGLVVPDPSTVEASQDSQTAPQVISQGVGLSLAAMSVACVPIALYLWHKAAIRHQDKLD